MAQSTTGIQWALLTWSASTPEQGNWAGTLKPLTGPEGLRVRACGLGYDPANAPALWARSNELNQAVLSLQFPPRPLTLPWVVIMQTRNTRPVPGWAQHVPRLSTNGHDGIERSW